MKPVVLLLLVLAVVAMLTLAGWLTLRWLGRRAGVRQAEFKRLAADRDQLARALAQIEAKADMYRDLDSVLATDVRQILRQLNETRMERYR